MRPTPNAIFKSLSDPTRRALFESLIRRGEQTVGTLTGHSGVSQPAVSKHLRNLKHVGLVGARREGRLTHYSARPRALAPLMDWMNFYSRFWQDRFGRLEDLLKTMNP
jgi:DNA-binding transcriptional ArsR family regulator